MSNLPVELLLKIAEEHCTSARDLNALAQTCRGFHGLVNPVVYRHNVSEEGGDAVLWACEHGRIDTLEHLREQGARFDLEFGVEVDVGSDAHRACFAPIHVAAKHGHVEVLAWLLDHGAKLDAFSRDYCDCQLTPKRYTHPERRQASRPYAPLWSALHTAVCHDHTDAAIFLIERGASLMVSERREENVQRGLPAAPNVTVTHTAAAANNVALIDYLAARRLADFDAADDRGNAAAHYAATGASTGAALMRIMRVWQPWVEINDSRVSTIPFRMALFHCAFGSALMLLKAGNHDLDDAEKASQILLDAAQAYPKLMWDSTIPHWIQQRDAFVHELLALGYPVDVTSPNARRTTPLHRFASEPKNLFNPALFEALFAAGANPCTYDAAGYTPFHTLVHTLNSHANALLPSINSAAYTALLNTISLFVSHGASLIAPLPQHEDDEVSSSPSSSPSTPTPATTLPQHALDLLLGGPSPSHRRLPPWRSDLAHAVLTLALARATPYQDYLLRSALWPFLSKHCVGAGRVEACAVLVGHGAVWRVMGRWAMANVVRDGFKNEPATDGEAVVEAVRVCLGEEGMERVCEEAVEVEMAEREERRRETEREMERERESERRTWEAFQERMRWQKEGLGL
jgi:ankyrin repeat protein